MDGRADAVRAMTGRRAAAWVLAAPLALSLVACSGGQGAAGGGAAGVQDAASFTYAESQSPDTFNPVMQDEHTDPVTEMVFRGLVGHDAQNQVVPALATGWTVSADGLTYELALRDDVTWHDGEPFTSADVVFTLDAVRDPGSGAATQHKLAALDSVEALDDTTVVITLSRPDAALLDDLAMGILPEHVLAGEDITDPAFGRAPIGTGPFELVDVETDQFARLEANDAFYGGAPRLDEVIITYVPDASARAVQLATGEVDAAYVEPQQAAAVEEDEDLRLEVWPTADYRALMINMDDPTLADPRVRRALNHAVDRDALVDGVLLGYGEPATGPLRGPYEQPGAAPSTFDPATVGRLMTEAGYARGGSDGAGPWTKDGEPVSFSVSTFAEDDLRVAMGDVVTTQLKEQGFDAVADPQPRDAVTWEDLDTFVIGWGTPYHPDTSLYSPFHSSQVLAQGGSNLGSYVNADVDAALDAGRTARDEDAEAQAYGRFQEAIAEDPPYVWLAYLQALNAFPADFAGPQERTLEHHGYGLFWNAEDWRWE